MVAFLSLDVPPRYASHEILTPRHFDVYLGFGDVPILCPFLFAQYVHASTSRSFSHFFTFSVLLYLDIREKFERYRVF